MNLMRAALNWFTFTGGIELHSIADIPGGTGLGSSSSFTVGAGGYRSACWAADERQCISEDGMALLRSTECKKAIGYKTSTPLPTAG
jgi:homoserine kinase